MDDDGEHVDVIVDSNQIISDFWLKSQRFAVLSHYLRKTASRLLILEPVLSEAREHFSREVRRHLADAVDARESLARLGVELSLPDVDALHRREVDRWAATFQSTLREVGAFLPFQSEVVEEAFRRATCRLPPCKASGEGMRDAVIWLSALRAFRDRSSGEMAFISANTKDFADSSTGQLRPELEVDVSALPFPIHYYASVADFNRAHSDRIAHITPDWIRERVSEDHLRETVAFYVARHGELLRPSDEDFADGYDVAGEPYLSTVDVDIEDYNVWRLDADRIAIALVVGAFVEGEAPCDWVSPIPHGFVDEEGRLTRRRVLSCMGYLGFDITAEVRGNEIVLGTVEEAYRV